MTYSNLMQVDTNIKFKYKILMSILADYGILKRKKMITLKSTVFSVKVMNLSKIQTKFGCFVNN